MRLLVDYVFHRFVYLKSTNSQLVSNLNLQWYICLISRFHKLYSRSVRHDKTVSAFENASRCCRPAIRFDENSNSINQEANRKGCSWKFEILKIRTRKLSNDKLPCMCRCTSIVLFNKNPTRLQKYILKTENASRRVLSCHFPMRRIGTHSNSGGIPRQYPAMCSQLTPNERHHHQRCQLRAA